MMDVVLAFLQGPMRFFQSQWDQLRRHLPGTRLVVESTKSASQQPGKAAPSTPEAAAAAAAVQQDGPMHPVNNG